MLLRVFYFPDKAFLHKELTKFKNLEKNLESGTQFIPIFL